MFLHADDKGEDACINNIFLTIAYFNASKNYIRYSGNSIKKLPGP